MEEESKYTDGIVKELLNEQELEGPSIDFTATIMKRIYADEPITVQEPIISVKVWCFIAAIVFAIVVAAIGEGKTLDGEFAKLFDWKWSMPSLDVASKLSTPLVLFFSVLLWALFFVDKLLLSKLKTD